MWVKAIIPMQVHHLSAGPESEPEPEVQRILLEAAHIEVLPGSSPCGTSVAHSWALYQYLVFILTPGFTNWKSALQNFTKQVLLSLIFHLRWGFTASANIRRPLLPLTSPTYVVQTGTKFPPASTSTEIYIMHVTVVSPHLARHRWHCTWTGDSTTGTTAQWRNLHSPRGSLQIFEFIFK